LFSFAIIVVVLRMYGHVDAQILPLSN